MAIHKLTTPLSEEIIRKLHIKDIVYLSGTIFTARDKAHERALKWLEQGKELPIDLSGAVVFHCGPLVKKVEENWELVAAGPTTSARMEPFEDKFINAFKVRMIIGKGGMGPKTVNAMKEVGSVYSIFTGGAAVLAAKAVKNIKRVEWLDLGMAEALWMMDVEKFGPLIIAIDSTGKNLFEEVMNKVEINRKKLYKMLGF
ncbi:MAG: FumA C-terminus/TtdB family hydratase beta subunit [Promethearchaeota archaeon]